MDIDMLQELIGKIERKELELVAKDLREPSAFAQEIVNARPYAFLDDTEFAERRVNAVRNRGWLDPAEAHDLSRLDIKAIERVQDEAWPQAQTPDELHDAFMIHGFITQKEGEHNGWEILFESLMEQGRAVRFSAGANVFWIAVERLSLFQAIYPDGNYSPDVNVPENLKVNITAEDALKEIIRGRLEALGPVTLDQLASDSQLPESKIQYAILTLEKEGFVFRGQFTPDLGRGEWCERRLLQRIHKYTIESLRESIQPVSVQDFMRFLLAFHKMRAEDEQTGPVILQEVLSQLEGFEAPAAAWETDLIPGRMKEYDPAWLDVLCMSGKIVWGRFNPPKSLENGRKTGPIKSTPICLVPRQHEFLWRQLVMDHAREKHLSSLAESIYKYLKSNGASFFDDIVKKTGLLKSQVEEGIGELVAHGLIVSDSYSGLRSLLTPEHNKPSANNRLKSRLHKSRQAFFGIEHAGRWALMQTLDVPETETLEYETLEEIIFIYLKRWGVLFRSLIEKEAFAPPWRILVRVLRRMELRGELRGGRFIEQVSGEQFALPETIEYLRQIRKSSKTGELISITAADPLNLLGVILPGKRVSNITSNRILYQDGIPIAVLEGKETHYLKPMDPQEQWQAQKALVLRKFPHKLRYYLGRNYV
jgi:ATP-dependent Lhr-like helicase